MEHDANMSQSSQSSSYPSEAGQSGAGRPAAVSKSSADATSASITFVGIEHHLLGLSPQYWANTPMLIGDILSLRLINGVDCMLPTTRTTSAPAHHTRYDEHDPDTHACPEKDHVLWKKRRRLVENPGDEKIPVFDHVVPISRCEIVGFIVSKERKANSTLYLLDDGTGLIDCISWEDDGDGMYTLPPLVETYPYRNISDENTFHVGDCVRIRGKIKCISVGSESRTIDIPVGSKNNGVASTCNLRRFEVPVNVTREIAVATMERVLDQGTNNGLDAETTHWLKCVRFAKRIAVRHVDETIVREDFGPIRNGADVLNLLGDAMISKLSQTVTFDVGEEGDGAWRVFGPDCTCHLPHKDELLYCHCLATFEALDPHHVFRDTLLKHLVDMMGGNSTNPLRFYYGSLQEDQHLLGIAAKTVSETSNPDVNVRRLYFNTFKALQNDGIIFLDDQDADIYLLISKSSVLIPYLTPLVSKEASSLEKSLRRSNPPPFIKKVPASRLRYVTKCLLAKSRKNETGEA